MDCIFAAGRGDGLYICSHERDDDHGDFQWLGSDDAIGGLLAGSIEWHLGNGDEWVDEENLPRVAGAFSALLTSLDNVPRAQLASCDYPLRRQWMKILQYLMRLKTTRLGTRPIH